MHPIRNNARYTIKPEGTFPEGPLKGRVRYVLRHDGVFLDASISRSRLIMLAIGHKAVADGAEVITEVRAPGTSHIPIITGPNGNPIINPDYAIQPA